MPKGRPRQGSRRGVNTPERLLDKVPHGHWKTTTFLATLRWSGLTAQPVLDGGINGPTFVAWGRQELVPTLQPDDTVVMDNLPSRPGTRQSLPRSSAAVFRANTRLHSNTCIAWVKQLPELVGGRLLVLHVTIVCERRICKSVCCVGHRISRTSSLNRTEYQKDGRPVESLPL